MRNGKQIRCVMSSYEVARKRQLLFAASAALGSLAFGGASFAATHVYNPPAFTTDLWTAGTNWDSTPVSGAATRLTFVGSNATTFANGFTNASTNDVANPFLLNILDLQGMGPGAGSSASIAIDGSGLNLVSNGATTPVVNLNALDPTLAYNINAPITLTNNTLFTGAGTAKFTFAGGINSGVGITLTKNAASNLTIGGTSSVQGTLTIGTNNNANSKVTVASGGLFTVGNAGTGTLSVGTSNTTTAGSGILDASAAAGFTANVAIVNIGGTGNNNVGAVGTLNLPSTSSITANTSFIVGNSTGAQNNTTSVITTAGGGTTTIRTPNFTIGSSKANATLTLGAGNTLDLAGVGTGVRGSLTVGNMTAGGGGGTYTSNANLAAGNLNASLVALFVGNQNTASSTSNMSATMTIGGGAGSTSNHLDLAGPGSPLIVGRQQISTATGIATGTLNINNLDATSVITSTNNGTAILVGSAIGAGRAVGNLNLNGGTLTITTTGQAIGSSTTNGTANVKFNSTTLRAGAASSNWISGLSNATVETGGALFDTNGFNITIPQNLAAGSPSGGLAKSGAGTLTLSGASTYTGATNINAGRLDLTGSLTSNVSVNNTTAVGGEGSTTGSLTFFGSSRLFFDPASGGSMTAGSVDATGATVEVLGGSAPVGTGFVVLNATGGITGTPGTNFVYNNRGSIYVAGNQLLVDNTGPATINWVGDQANPTLWDIKTTSNWDNVGSSDMFFTGDTVIFNDLAVSRDVVIQPAAVNPAAVFFVNDDSPYTLSGGAINGNATLSKDGSSSLIVSNNNTFTGGTTINGGTLQLGDGTNSTGTLGTGTITNNASLVTDYGGNNATVANVIGGVGTLTKNGSGTLIVSGTNTYVGGTTINAGTVQLGDSVRANGSFGTGPVVNNGAIVTNFGINAATVANDISGTGSFTQAGAGIISLTGTNSYGVTTINIGATLQIGNGGATGTLGSGPVTNNGTLSFNRADDTPVANAISGPGTLNKLGAGTLTLTNITTSAGNLIIGNQAIGGTLAVGAGSSLSIGSGPTNFVLIGGSTIPSGAAYSGTLDVSAADSFTANVGTFSVGYTPGGSPLNTSSGTLLLGTNNTITAATEFRVGRSENQPMQVGGTVSTAASGTTTVKTPLFTVGTNKSSGMFTLGSGATLNVAGLLPGERSGLTVGTANLATGTAATSALDMSVGTFTANLGAVIIGDHNHNGAGNLTSSVTLGGSAANHLDISAAGTAVLVGRKQLAGAATSVAMLTIGNLDATSSITSTTNGTGILLGTNANATGTLNLNGGTLTITTTGAAIAGGSGGTSDVNFNGTTLLAGDSSPAWIHNLTSASIQSGRAKFDTNGFNVTIPQPLLAGTPDGGVTKLGSGALTLSAANTYTGTTTVNGGTLIAANADALGAGALGINDSTVEARASLPKAVSVASISTTGSGRFDLTNNALVIKNSDRATVTAQIVAGYNNGDFLGTGITSSTAANDPNFLTAIGYASNLDAAYTTFEGVTGLDDGDILVKYTYYGDADLTGSVDLDDFNLFLAGYQDPANVPQTWIYGDFDYTGSVDLDDFNLFLAAYQANGAPLSALAGAVGDTGLSASDQQLMLSAIAAVPEPGALGVLTIGACGLLVRRRRGN
jgi:fibronectin-binding autotransporter adhesin